MEDRIKEIESRLTALEKGQRLIAIDMKKIAKEGFQVSIQTLKESESRIADFFKKLLDDTTDHQADPESQD